MSFKFFRGKKIKEARSAILQPRYPRAPLGFITYPENFVDMEQRRIYRRGWRACERGNEIYNNPYNRAETLIYSLYDAWERGFLECYLNHPIRIREGNTDVPIDRIRNSQYLRSIFRHGRECARRNIREIPNEYYVSEIAMIAWVMGYNDAQL